ncbi:MAG: hypothetical protein RLZZ381_559 [Cyanobacteriota bacterium]|jgi:uncharacterized protein
MVNRFNPLVASVILGFLWGLWHFPVKFTSFITFGFGGGLSYLATFTLRLIFVSIIMTYFWSRVGQTTIIAIAMHGLINDSIGLGGRIESENFIPQLFTEVTEINEYIERNQVPDDLVHPAVVTSISTIA